MTAAIFLAFFRRDAITRLSYRAELALGAAAALFSVATFHFIAGLLSSAPAPALAAYGGSYFPFVLLGLAASGYQAAALHAFASNLRQEQSLGTLEAVLLTPVRAPVFLLACAQWDFLRATLDATLYAAIACVFFGLSFPAANLPAAVAVAALAACALLSLGIASAAFMLRFKRGEPVAWIVGSLSDLLGGVFFPVALLPDPLRAAAALFPVTHALEGLRATLLRGASLPEVSGSLLALGAFSVVLLPAGLYAFRRALDAARRDGSLGHY